MLSSFVMGVGVVTSVLAIVGAVIWASWLSVQGGEVDKLTVAKAEHEARIADLEERLGRLADL